MKKLSVFIISLFLLVFDGFGQKEISMQIDSLIFNKQVGNTYQSEATGAVLLWIKMPMSFDQLLPGTKHESNPNAKVDKSEETMFEDVRVYLKLGRITEEDKTTLVEAYLLEWTDSECIIVTATYSEEVQEIIGNKVRNAVKSLVRNK